MNNLNSTTNKATLTAGLVVITNQNGDDFDQYSYLLKYVDKKLKYFHVTLKKTFVISLNDYGDIVKQVNQLLSGTNGNSLNWLLLTTTNPTNDTYLSKIHNELNPSPGDVTRLNPATILLGKRLFLIPAEGFYVNFATVLNQITLNQCQNLTFLFNDQKELEQFIEQLASKVNYRQIKSNYAKLAVQIDQLDPGIHLPLIAKHFNFTVNSNFKCADFLVYEFEHFSQQSMNHDDDLNFLRTKISLNEFYAKLKHSIDVTEKALVASNDQQQEICVSFNGGKDCCVVLYILYAVATRKLHKLPLNVLIIKIRDSFEEMDRFMVQEIESFYAANSIEFIFLEDTTKSLKDNLFELKEKRPALNWIWMGTRRTDSGYFKTMNDLAPTDNGWPSFVRVNPILDWTYSEIWYFIRALKLPYCDMYDRGYTSIDSCADTVPNRALFDAETNAYGPAYLLEDGSLERESRVKRNK